MILVPLADPYHMDKTIRVTKLPEPGSQESETKKQRVKKINLFSVYPMN